jgi:serine/threonine-protein kinase RsbW
MESQDPTGGDGRPGEPQPHSAPPTEIVTRWPNSPRTAGRARHQLRIALKGWGLDEVADAAELVVSELVTNAARHARLPRGRLVETRYKRCERGVRVEVHDANEGRPRLQNASVRDESGRGLALVDAVTGGRWGVRARLGPGKAVWAYVGEV